VIPRRLIRTVPEHPTAAQDELWARARALHPDWEHINLQDPIDPAQFPTTSPLWSKCESGAQLAGLVRLEALVWGGGIYIDSDVVLYRSLEPLRAVSAFAAYEDPRVIPDAVLGAEPEHPAFVQMLKLAVARMRGAGNERDWQTNAGSWSTGPGVTTTVLQARDDVLVLGPEAFYPVHYHPRETLEQRLESFKPQPWNFGLHRWDWSWR
jgi:mannosyltransferase OCH1-like enzyme